MKNTNRRPFIFGFALGAIMVTTFSNKIKKMVKGKITVIQIDIRELSDDKESKTNTKSSEDIQTSEKSGN